MSHTDMQWARNVNTNKNTVIIKYRKQRQKDKAKTVIVSRNKVGQINMRRKYNVRRKYRGEEEGNIHVVQDSTKTPVYWLENGGPG